MGAQAFILVKMGGDSNMLIDFMAGGVSGAIAKTCTAPIERVKLIIQTQDANPRIISGEVPRYTGIGNCFTRVAAEQGIGAFWRGNLTNCIRYFPTQAFNFMFKDKIKRLFPKYGKDQFGMRVLTNVASGGLAGAGSLCIVYPLDYARTRLASDVGSGKREFSGLFDTLADLNPYAKDRSIVGIASKFGCAQVTAITAGYASYPFDTVRRRLQMQSNKPVEEWVYKGTADCFAKVAKEEGITAFFKGAGANALRTVGSALVLVLYGEIKALIGVN